MGKSCPAPSDLAKHAKVMTANQLALHYDAGFMTVKRWLAKTGIEASGNRKPVNARPVPGDFAQHAPTMCVADLQRLYNARHETVKRWLDEAGIPRLKRTAHNIKPLPIDFAARAQTMHLAALCRHYGAIPDTVKRWATEAGVAPAQHAPDANAMHRWRHWLTVGVSGTVKSMYDEAADTLRRERFPVNRCDERGAFDGDGKFWRVGWSVLTGDELLAKAAKYDRRAA